MIAHIGDSTTLTRDLGTANGIPGWTNGELAFHDALVATVLADVGHWYGYQFRLNDSTLAGQRITTVLETNHTAHVLAMLEDLLDVSMTVDGNIVTVRPHHRSLAPRVPAREDAKRQYSTPSEVGK
jgi:ferric-dicitrate binding protein FerR (iron transport regulator)